MISDLGNSVFLDFEPNEYQLTGWTSYTPITAPRRGMNAQTDVDIHGPTFTTGTDGTDITVTRVQGYIRIRRSNSWVSTPNATAELLEHEQGHYYIGYIPYVLALKDIRRLRIPLSSAHVSARDSEHTRQTKMRNAVTLRIRSMMQSAQQTMATLSTQYDAELPPGTNHGRNRPEQAAWNQRFARAIANGTPI